MNKRWSWQFWSNAHSFALRILRHAQSLRHARLVRLSDLDVGVHQSGSVLHVCIIVAHLALPSRLPGAHPHRARATFFFFLFAGSCRAQYDVAKSFAIIYHAHAFARTSLGAFILLRFAHRLFCAHFHFALGHSSLHR